MKLADFYRPTDADFKREQELRQKREAEFYKKYMGKTVPLMLSDDLEDQLIAEYLQAKLRLDQMMQLKSRYEQIPGAHIGSQSMELCIEEMNRYVMLLAARVARTDLQQRIDQKMKESGYANE